MSNTSNSTCDFHTDVDLFSLDIRLLFLQCSDSGLGLAGILLVAALIKLFQNTLYQKIGQKQRELLQETKERRAKSALLVLVLLELIAGITGIVSILVITGNNAFVWIVIILSNCAGTFFAFRRAKPDHHSTSKDIMGMLKHYDNLNEKSNEKKLTNTETEERTLIKKTLRKLRTTLLDPETLRKLRTTLLDPEKDGNSQDGISQDGNSQDASSNGLPIYQNQLDRYSLRARLII